MTRTRHLTFLGLMLSAAAAFAGCGEGGGDSDADVIGAIRYSYEHGYGGDASYSLTVEESNDLSFSGQGIAGLDGSYTGSIFWIDGDQLRRFLSEIDFDGLESQLDFLDTPTFNVLVEVNGEEVGRDFCESEFLPGVVWALKSLMEKIIAETEWTPTGGTP
ncbi:MAG TPA: hypothetical protein PK668_21695 [Myxococcota bacterium]|nr:hypothetical protein [Myxococcota bacterium]HRY96092.1 hypothetical protein [Myxococcota bacterium]